MTVECPDVELSLLNEIVKGEAHFREVKVLGKEADDFYSETLHRLVFGAIERLHGRGEPIEVLILSGELNSTPRPYEGKWILYITNVLGPSMPMWNITYHVGEIRRVSREI